MMRLAALTMAAVLAPLPGEPLGLDVFDASGFPIVVFDLVAPATELPADITPDAIVIEGGSVQSVAPIDRAEVAVSLVIDDGPVMGEQAVQDGQGAAVELVRETADGTQVAVATPSGLSTRFTADKEANIQRVSGIVAGSPDVVPLPQLVLEMARDLAASPSADRHLVVIAGTSFPAGAVFDELADVVTAAGIRVHVVTAAGLDAGAIVGLSEATGGLSPVAPTAVGEIDDVIRAIRARVRVTARFEDPGVHGVTLTLGGRAYGGQLDVVAPGAVPATTSRPSGSADEGERDEVTPATPARGTAAEPAAEPAAPDRALTTTPSTASGGSDGSSDDAGLLLIAGGLMLVAVVALGVWLVLRRRAIARMAETVRENERLAAERAQRADQQRRTGTGAAMARARPPVVPPPTVPPVEEAGTPRRGVRHPVDEPPTPGRARRRNEDTLLDPAPAATQNGSANAEGPPADR